MGTHKPRACEMCGTAYRPTYGEQRTCGRACGVALRRAEHGSASSRPPGRCCRRCGRLSEQVTRQARICRECADSGYAPRACDVCGATFTPSSSAQVKRCGPSCHRQAAARYVLGRYHANPAYRDQVLAAAHTRRASRLGLPAAKILLTYLIRRDHGQCGICHKPVRTSKGRMRPSIDHILPLSRGGKHELANVQLAHYSCNLVKGNRGHGEQLLLIG